MQRVLVVEDCADQWRLIERAIGSEFEIRHSDSLRTARTLLDRWQPDLVLLDVGLPDGEGFALCSELRNRNGGRTFPVLFISGRRELTDKLTAFALGADDFIDKPFEAAELRARIAARLRKHEESRRRDAIRILGPLRVDLARFRAQIRDGDGDRDLDLTPHEMRLLCALAEVEGRVLSRAQLVEALVGDCAITERTIDSHLYNLRRKLGPLRKLVETVRGVGYRLALPRRVPDG